MKKETIFLICLLCLLKINIYSQTFESDRIDGCSPLTVVFDNKYNENDGYTFYWDLGNGTTSSLYNPVGLYTETGYYTVKLVASKDGVNDTIIKKNYIRVFKNPTANFNTNSTKVDCAPLPIQFDDLSTEGDTTINVWHWDFGNGHISNEQNPAHVFNYQDTYSVSLFVIDKNNCSNLTMIEDFITAYKPQANFDIEGSSSCTGTLETQFTNQSTGNEELTYFWDFGDGNTSNIKNPINNYNNFGVYDVKLITYDNFNCTDTLLKPSIISISKLIADFEINKDTICPYEYAVFTNNSVSANSYIWDFGDGSSSTLKNPTHRYTQAGNYTIKLIANSNSGCTDTISLYINVEGVIANYTSSTDFGCSTPLSVEYYDNSTNAVAYEWHFVNGTTSYEKNPIHIYTTEGIFNDTLIVTSPHGCKNRLIRENSISIRKPRAAFSPNNWVNVNELKGCVPLTVQFTDKSTYNTNKDNINQWQWNFGDGASSNSKNPSHQFTDVGEFQVNLTITTSLGCSSTYFATAKTGTKQNASFNINVEDTICASTLVSFTDTSEEQSKINGWYWIFGDGEISQEQNPTHTYVDTGYMDVKLLVYYNGCGNEELKENLLYIKGPYINPKYSTECENPLIANFNSNVIDANKIYWNYGDGSPIDSTSYTPQHEYSSSGNYEVIVTAISNSNNCQFQTTKNVFIRDIKANFETSQDIGCQSITIDFNSESSTDESIFYKNGSKGTYYWNFDDGTKIMTNVPEISHQFNTKGVFDVELLVKDFRACSDTIKKQIKIYKPSPSFSAIDINGCLPMNVEFENTTVIDTTINLWQWSFGDNTYSSDENTNHDYTTHGVYDVSLTATDIIGCTSTYTKYGYIEALKPKPNFIADDQTVCVGDSIEFFSLTTENISSCYWDFGDGYASDSENPKHFFADSGYYNVSLKLTDNKGCDSTYVISNYIHVQKATIPDFTVDNTFSNCYPMIVQFTDQTNADNINKWLWKFDENNSSSQIQNPVHTFTKPGMYDVTLTATTTYGCSAKYTKENLIEVGGPYAEILAPNIICKNTDIKLIADNQLNVHSLQWFFDDGNIGVGDTVTHFYNKFGTVNPILLLMSDNEHTCDKYIRDTIVINKVIASVSGVKEDFEGCVPFEANFIDNSTNAKYWNWNFGDNNYSNNQHPVNNYKKDGKYNLELIVTDYFGCTDTTNKEISVFPLPTLSINNDTLICYGEKVNLKAEGAEKYYWYPALYLNTTISNSPVSIPERSIKYNLMAVDTNKCVNYSSTAIQVQLKPKININDTSIVIGEIVNLNAYANDISTYLWSSESYIDCNNCSSITVNPLESSVYKISVTDTNNCFTVSKEINVDIMKKYSIDIPTAFTPNNDGINDIIFVKGWGVKELIEFKIYNRFGELIFVSHDKNIGWDGCYKGNPQNIETYIYTAKIKTYENEILTKTGNIKLLR